MLPLNDEIQNSNGENNCDTTDYNLLVGWINISKSKEDSVDENGRRQSDNIHYTESTRFSYGSYLLEMTVHISSS